MSPNMSAPGRSGWWVRCSPGTAERCPGTACCAPMAAVPNTCASSNWPCSRLAAGELRDRVTARLQRTISEPVARTFHSYAFGLVRRAAVLAGDPPPRLLSGSEQDVTLRELLAGRLADRSDDWPAELAAAV